MRLTVGPLPAAVYWRRRAVVLIGLAMVVLVVAYSCGGGDPTAEGPPSPSGSASASGAATRTPGSSSAPSRPGTPTSTTRPAFTLPAGGATGPCTDAEMAVTAAAADASVQRRRPVEVTIRIRNVSRRTCARDVGADVQELRILDGGTVIWSSDDCSPNKGRDVRSFPANREVSFTLTWTGRRSRTGAGSVTCLDAAPAPEPAVYQLVARLDGKLSDPVDLRVTTAAESKG
jgi:hypothetical protein